MDLRERIIENSMEMFLHRGCKSVTMDDIATENGISKRTLYELFSDKSTFLAKYMTKIYIYQIGECSKDLKGNEIPGQGHI